MRSYLCSTRTFVCKQSFPTRVNSAYYRSQQELVTVNNNTAVLQTVIIDLVNCYRSYFSDYYSCMLFMFLVNRRNLIPVYLANSEQIVQPSVYVPECTGVLSLPEISYENVTRRL